MAAFQKSASRPSNRNCKAEMFFLVELQFRLHFVQLQFTLQVHQLFLNLILPYQNVVFCNLHFRRSSLPHTPETKIVCVHETKTLCVCVSTCMHACTCVYICVWECTSGGVYTLCLLTCQKGVLVDDSCLCHCLCMTIRWFRSLSLSLHGNFWAPSNPHKDKERKEQHWPQLTHTHWCNTHLDSIVLLLHPPQQRGRLFVLLFQLSLQFPDALLQSLHWAGAAVTRGLRSVRYGGCCQHQCWQGIGVTAPEDLFHLLHLLEQNVKTGKTRIFNFFQSWFLSRLLPSSPCAQRFTESVKKMLSTRCEKDA